MKITKKWLEKNGACQSNIDWFLNQSETDCAKIMLALTDSGRSSDALWIFEQLATKPNAVRVAIFAAKLTIGNFEAVYPYDQRPRKAIEAAEAYLENPCKKTKDAAEIAAWAAASSATLVIVKSSAASAAWATSRAASAAASSEEIAVRRAAMSGSSAAMLASSAASLAVSLAVKSSAAGEKEMQIKIIQYIIEILDI